MIARTAGVDKVLIYRYFGGLDGLLTKFSETADILWTFDEVIDGLPATEGSKNLPNLCAMALARQLEALKKSPYRAANHVVGAQPSQLSDPQTQ